MGFGPGSRVLMQLPAGIGSLCAYLAIEGGIALPRVLGSASTHARSGLGGHHGRRLQSGDLLLLPIKPEEVEHQHFNLDPSKPCHWIAFVYMPIYDYLAGEIAQVEIAPEFSKSGR